MHAESDLSADAPMPIHVERPDIVRRHLQFVTRSCDPGEFLLQRIAESNAFPSMDSPQLQAEASLLRRRLSAGQNLEEFGSIAGNDDNVKAVASMLRILMTANGLSMSDVTSLLQLPGHTSVSSPLLLRPGGLDGT